MNTEEQLARMDEWLAANPAPPSPPDPTTHYDEDTLRRSFEGLSRGARREQRRPRVERAPEEWMDETAVASGEWTGDAA